MVQVNQEAKILSVEHNANNLGKQALLLAQLQTCWIFIFNPRGDYFNK